MKKAFYTQKSCAKRRGIKWELTFDQWLLLWIESGCLAQRGGGPEQYVMARIGDRGPYAVGNVKIITGRQNSLERRCTEVCRAKMRAAAIGNNNAKGHKQTAYHRSKISRALLGKKNALGCQRSAETRARMSSAQLQRYQKES